MYHKTFRVKKTKTLFSLQMTCLFDKEEWKYNQREFWSVFIYYEKQD